MYFGIPLLLDEYMVSLSTSSRQKSVEKGEMLLDKIHNKKNIVVSYDIFYYFVNVNNFSFGVLAFSGLRGPSPAAR